MLSFFLIHLQYIPNFINCEMFGLINKLFLILVFGIFCLAATSAPDWLERKSEHFILYFTQDEKFAQQVLDEAEKYYRNIALNLDYARYCEFWTWDNRVKIYIYPDW